MGLDSIWKNKFDETATVEGDFNLCGGLFSGRGNNSFRGKVYNHMITEVTGVSLYNEVIEAIVIKRMAEKLQAVTWDSQFGFKYDIDEQEFKSVVAMFVAHAAEDHKLIGWW